MSWRCWKSQSIYTAAKYWQFAKPTQCTSPPTVLDSVLHTLQRNRIAAVCWHPLWHYHNIGKKVCNQLFSTEVNFQVIAYSYIQVLFIMPMAFFFFFFKSNEELAPKGYESFLPMLLPDNINVEINCCHIRRPKRSVFSWNR